MKKQFSQLLSIYIFLASVQLFGEALMLVDTDVVLRTDADKVVGINLNYMRDHDANRESNAKPLNDVLKEMSAKWLRYPGGEKSDFHLWSRPPYEKPEPISIGWYQTCPGERIDFDDYIETVRTVGAAPYVVVAYDNEERTGITKAQFLENAVSWVKYANVTKQYGIQYWEVGNENWHNETGSAEDLAKIVVEFSEAMKAVDPSIKIGASGNNPAWWKSFLREAAPALDFVSLSLYNCYEWSAYDYYIEHPDYDLIEPVNKASNAIDALSQEDRDRLSIVVAETNSKDYSEGGWSSDNTIGHALVTFDTLGQLLLKQRVTAGLLWNTRWIDDTEAAQSIWYGLGPANSITPSGRAVAIWGQFAHDTMISATSHLDLVAGYASRNTESGDLSLFVINKGFEPVAGEFKIRLESPDTYRIEEVYCFSGKGADDVSPTWERSTNGQIDNNMISHLDLPGVSITIITLRRIETQAINLIARPLF